MQTSPWQSFGKRAFDVLVSSAALLLLSPLLLAIAVAIRLDSRGPVFFRQERVGLHFAPFQIIKFRSMVSNAAELGGMLTAGNRDRRITRMGRLLRATKLDELPQLINVLMGQMSLVGPRPEVRKYVDLFRDDYEQLLSVRPGITDPASIKYSDEGAILAKVDDPEHRYVTQILPEKLELSREYVAHQTCLRDIRLLTETLLRVAHSGFRKLFRAPKRS